MLRQNSVNIRCYNCNKSRHMTKQCRRKEVQNPIKLTKKINVENVRDDMKKIWKKKETIDASTPSSGVGTSFGN